MTTFLPFDPRPLPTEPHGPARPTTADLEALAKAYDEARETAAYALMADVRAGEPSAWPWRCGQEAQAAKEAHQLAYALWAHDPGHADRLNSFVGGASGRTYEHRCVLCERAK